jgi:opacity protein-like surface antigen
MRRLLIALGLIGLIGIASDAVAAEFELPTLRGSDAFIPAPYEPGPPTFFRWSGFYAGGQLGFGNMHGNFSGSTGDLVAYALRNTTLQDQFRPSDWPVLGSTDTTGGSFGGFVGYNLQLDEVILGLEANYSRTSIAADAPNSPIDRVVTTSDPATYDLAISGAGNATIHDVGTLRARVGYVAGNLLPYAMGGLAVGRGDFFRSVTMAGTVTVPANPNPITSPFLVTASELKNSAYMFGWSVGGGLDAMIMPHVFVRGEVEYVHFQPVMTITTSLVTARVGGGIKF